MLNGPGAADNYCLEDSIYLNRLTGFHNRKIAVGNPWPQSHRVRRADEANQQPHARSGNAGLQYHVHASGREIGHVESMLDDEET